MSTHTRSITWGMGEHFIERLASHLITLARGNAPDFSRIACVFGGRRPALFLRRSLARAIGTSLIPPRVFSIDEFVDYLIPNGSRLRKPSDLDSAYCMYTLAKKEKIFLLKERKTFAEFLPWAREIVSFIEQLDLEQIGNAALTTVEKSARIGYEIPESVNKLLTHITALRTAYHDILTGRGIASRGMRYGMAAECAHTHPCEEFDHILFCNFFYLHSSEEDIIKRILQRGKGTCLFQGSQNEWPVLEHVAKRLGVSIIPDHDTTRGEPQLHFYQGFDIHSQVCLVRQILETKILKKENSLIVLPRPQALIPLLSHVSSQLEDCNVSMGYPLKRSPLYSLLAVLQRAQESRKNGQYYSTDYLSAVKHPLVKNLKLGADSRITRVLVHKLEELLAGNEESSIGGSLFIELSQIEDEGVLYARVAATLAAMGLEASEKECTRVLAGLHDVLFRRWEDVTTMRLFAERLGELLELLMAKSTLAHYSYNVKVLDALFQLQEELASAEFRDETFTPGELWEIFEQKLEKEIISFAGSPLSGTQVLGLLETRSLNFDEVVIIDANESILPKLKVHEPLIPREVMLQLGLNRLEKEEEIQRYQFLRLIASSEHTHLVYAQNEVNEKSRFIEELLWRKQRATKTIVPLNAPRASFAITSRSRSLAIPKSGEMVDFLRQQTYSASRINTYLNCPLQFYFQYVLGLQEKEDLLEEPQGSCIGTFIHELLKDTFERFRMKKPLIDKKFRADFLRVMDEKFEREIARRMKSDAFLLKGLIRVRLDKFLEHEASRPVVRILSLEEERLSRVSFEDTAIQFKYTIDRLDEMEGGGVTIIDYKTGGSDLAPKKLAALRQMELERESIRETIKSFQLPLYYHFVSQDHAQRSVNAELYSIRTLERKPFISDDEYEHRDEIRDICLEALRTLFTDLFDINLPFEPDRQERVCAYCPFIQMCG